MTRRHIRSIQYGLAAAGAAFLLAAGTTAFAGDSMKEMMTAEQHAGYAAGSKDLKMVHTHLQHVVNCLVGPKGKGFDAKAANPCKGMGDGAMMDTKDMGHKKGIEAAVMKAEMGMKEADLAKAQKTAAEVQAELKKASMM